MTRRTQTSANFTFRFDRIPSYDLILPFCFFFTFSPVARTKRNTLKLFGTTFTGMLMYVFLKIEAFTLEMPTRTKKHRRWFGFTTAWMPLWARCKGTSTNSGPSWTSCRVNTVPTPASTSTTSSESYGRLPLIWRTYVGWASTPEANQRRTRTNWSSNCQRTTTYSRAGVNPPEQGPNANVLAIDHNGILGQTVACSYTNRTFWQAVNGLMTTGSIENSTLDQILANLSALSACVGQYGIFLSIIETWINTVKLNDTLPTPASYDGFLSSYDDNEQSLRDIVSAYINYSLSKLEMNGRLS